MELTDAQAEMAVIRVRIASELQEGCSRHSPDVVALSERLDCLVMDAYRGGLKTTVA